MSTPYSVLENRDLDDLYYDRREPIVNGIALGRERYNLYENQLNPDGKYFDVLRGTHDKSQLNIAYFSMQNTDIIQSQIQSEVYRRSRGKYKIAKQDYTELQVVMRSIYLQNGQFGDTQIREQIKN